MQSIAFYFFISYFSLILREHQMVLSMKYLTIVCLTFITCRLFAQTDTLHAGVYRSGNNKPQTNGTVLKQKILSGTTLDLSHFEVNILTLKANKIYTPPLDDKKLERLIVVKSGLLNITLGDSSKTVGPGSLALILVGDDVKFKNSSTEPVSWYVLNFKSTNENIKRGHDAGASFIKDWNALTATITPKGETRQVFDRPTTMFERFDVHATVLNNGFNSHDPHTHRAEELILMIKGNSQFQIGQEKFHAGVGDAVFMASKILHAAQNTGSAPCGYYAIQWHNLKAD
jgi:(S)-ureidoglycine aminohydrolase